MQGGVAACGASVDAVLSVQALRPTAAMPGVSAACERGAGSDGRRIAGGC